MPLSSTLGDKKKRQILSASVYSLLEPGGEKSDFLGHGTFNQLVVLIDWDGTLFFAILWGLKEDDTYILESSSMAPHPRCVRRALETSVFESASKLLATTTNVCR